MLGHVAFQSSVREYADGSLGMLVRPSFKLRQRARKGMSGAFRDGSLGQVVRDGVLGEAYHDGSLGGAYRDGVLGDVIPASELFKQPLVIGLAVTTVAALAYAFTRK